MTLKSFLQMAVERITNQRCEDCRYNKGFFCEHPSENINAKCRNCIFPYGFETKEDRQ